MLDSQAALRERRIFLVSNLILLFTDQAMSDKSPKDAKANPANKLQNVGDDSANHKVQKDAGTSTDTLVTGITQQVLTALQKK